MTALTLLARPEQDAALRPLPWRRMAWVTWRQHRVALAYLREPGAAALPGPALPGTVRGRHAERSEAAK